MQFLPRNWCGLQQDTKARIHYHHALMHTPLIAKSDQDWLFLTGVNNHFLTGLTFFLTFVEFHVISLMENHDNIEFFFMHAG
jgi:hypothetical protein